MLNKMLLNQNHGYLLTCPSLNWSSSWSWSSAIPTSGCPHISRWSSLVSFPLILPAGGSGTVGNKGTNGIEELWDLGWERRFAKWLVCPAKAAAKCDGIFGCWGCWEDWPLILLSSGLRAFFNGGGAGDPPPIGGEASRLLDDKLLLELFWDGGGAGASASPLTWSALAVSIKGLKSSWRTLISP